MPLLSELFSEAGVTPDRLSGDVPIRRVCDDSRQAAPGDLFVCRPSMSGDSHRFFAEAVAKGASAVLAHSDEGFGKVVEAGVPAALVKDDGMRLSDALWRIAKTSFGNPSAKMRVFGVTGTNGKTTTTWILRDALAALGRKSAYLGTLGFQRPSGARELANTTPFAVETQGLLAEAATEGVEDFCMEVSSHALQERRSDGVEFDVAVFTNLTQDHLDYHGDMASYAAAKLRLFTDYPAQSSKPLASAINVDDSLGRSWASELKLPVVTFSRFQESADVRSDFESTSVDRNELGIVVRGERRILSVPLGGDYHIWNVLAAAAALAAAQVPASDIFEALPKIRPVPGRFEAVPNGRGFGILVDYAHTPDALEKLLKGARPYGNRIITVFGCGGDRDRDKRPKMARVASELSDVTIVTSDNPRTEDPHAIIAEILPGIVAESDHLAIADRPEAVAHAIRIAMPGDVVVIAGKGHENYQIVGRTKHPMDDRELARDALRSLEALR